MSHAGTPRSFRPKPRTPRNLADVISTDQFHSDFGSDGDRDYANVRADPDAPDPLQTLCDDIPEIDLEEKLTRLPALAAEAAAQRA